MSNAIRIEVSVTPLVFDGIKRDSEYRKGNLVSIQMRQEVTRISYYPSKRVSNELAGSLFTATECGFGEQSFTSVEKRVGWSYAPELVTEEQALKAVATCNANGGVIYRVLSHSPIITSDQQHWIDKGSNSTAHYANQQAMRHGEGDKNEGKLILVDGKVVYRKTFFWHLPKADQDLRGGEYYLSPELKAELAQDEQPFSGIDLKGEEPTDGVSPMPF